MGNDDAAPRLVQLGDWDVELSLLEEPGAAWDDLVSAWLPLESRLPPRSPDDFPSNGWRIVRTFHPEWAHEAMILGAPSQVEPNRWVLVQLSRDDNGWQFASPYSSCDRFPPKRNAGLACVWTGQKQPIQWRWDLCRRSTSSSSTNHRGSGRPLRKTLPMSRD